MGPRPPCPFSTSCYRKNPHHYREYSHPHLACLLSSHPDLQLPDSTPATAAVPLEKLRQQLVIYRDIERGLAKTPQSTSKAKSPAKPGQSLDTSPSVLASKRTPSKLSKPSPGPSKPSKPSPPTQPSKPSKPSSHDNLFDDSEDEELSKALRMSLDDQGGPSSKPAPARLSKNHQPSKPSTPQTLKPLKPSSQKDIFDDSEDAELDEALRRSLQDPGGGREERGAGTGERKGDKRPRSTSPSSQQKKSLIQRKLEAAEPYGFLLTKVEDLPSSHRDSHSIFLSDLLHPSLGQLASSLQINFMVELPFLTMAYSVHGLQDLPLVLLYGAENLDFTHPSLPQNIRAVRVKPKYPFGTHHTKMMVLTYSCGGVRVVVHTANLVGSDWSNRTQGLWVSPLCPALAPGATGGEGGAGFRGALLRYLRYYEVTAVHQFIAKIEKADMSAIKVAFVSSVPGSHKEGSSDLWGHRAVRSLLRRAVPPSLSSWGVIAQTSSIGSLGPTPDSWLEGELGPSLGSKNVRFVYPSKTDVLGSYDGRAGGNCLPYSRQTAAKQPWLGALLHHWRAGASNRTRAPPHIKTYTRERGGELAFFLLTSANLSKAAWGSVNKAGNSCLVMSYEAGVVWLPRQFGRETFTSCPFTERRGGSLDFPLHYSLPLTPYTGAERPWVMEDSLG